jgi:hypothetical protein
MVFREYSAVRIRQLLRPPETYNAYKINSRPPQLGDAGTVVDVMGSPGVPDSYVYLVESRECVQPGGAPVWLGEFTEVELEPLVA